MRQWRVYAVVVGSKYIKDVEAETEEEAQDIADSIGHGRVRLCQKCSSSCEDAEYDRFFVEEVDQQRNEEVELNGWRVYRPGTFWEVNDLEE